MRCRSEGLHITYSLTCQDLDLQKNPFRSFHGLETKEGNAIQSAFGLERDYLQTFNDTIPSTTAKKPAVNPNHPTMTEALKQKVFSSRMAVSSLLRTFTTTLVIRTPPGLF